MTNVDIMTSADIGHVAAFVIIPPTLPAIAEASHFRHLGDDVWYLNRVVVRPPLPRRDGIGSKLLDALKEKLVEQGCKRLIVEPGGYDNNIEEQTRFYLKNGFTVQAQPSPHLEWRPACDSPSPP